MQDSKNLKQAAEEVVALGYAVSFGFTRTGLGFLAIGKPENWIGGLSQEDADKLKPVADKYNDLELGVERFGRKLKVTINEVHEGFE